MPLLIYGVAVLSRSLCLIPAKGCSIRLPRKNLLPLNGEPLLSRAIEKAKSCEIFDEICVSTEDEEIAELARKCGASVPFIRPERLSRDPSTITDVMLHALEFYESKSDVFDTIFVMLPTSPFVDVTDIDTAMCQFKKLSKGVVMSVSTTEFPPFNAYLISSEGGRFLTPCFPDSPYKYVKSTECPKTYRSNGALLIIDVKQLLEKRSYREMSMSPYVMPLERSLDIDTKFDYEFAVYRASALSTNSQLESA